MTVLYKLDDKNNPVPCGLEDLDKSFHEDVRTRNCVGYEKIGPYTISTVFLGVDCNMGLGAPLLFETMVFKDEGAMVFIDEDYESSLLTRRYETWADAEEGHKKVLDWLKANKK